MKKIIIICLFICQGYFAISQNYELAKIAEAAFPEESVVLTDSKTIIEIEPKRSEKSVVAIKKIREKFINIDKNVRFSYPVFYGSESEIIKFDCGYSGVVKDSYYKAESIFHDDSRVKWGDYSVLKHGYESVLNADQLFTDMIYLTKVYFTNYYPCLKREIQFIIPLDVDVELIPFNFEGYDIRKTDEVIRKQRVITYTVENIDDFSEEEGMPGGTHVYPHLLINVKSFTYKDQKHELFKTLDDLYKWYHTLVVEVDNQPGNLQAKVDELVKGKTSDIEKIESIYYWVQDNIRYIAIEDGIAGFQPESCQNVYENRFGDCKGMANLAKEMLLLAGFDARLVWIGTKRIAYDYSTPSLACDNHMICAIKLNNEYHFLDPTEKYINWGEYAERIQNQDALIENGDEYVRMFIPKIKHNQNLQKIALSLHLKSNNELEGRVTKEIYGEKRSEFLYQMSTIGKVDHEKFAKKYIANFDDHIWTDNLELPDLNHGQEHVMIKANMTLKNYVSEFENEKYIYINPYKYFSELEFKDRKFDYWFSSKQKDIITVDFAVPVGYKIKSLPQNFTITDEEFEFIFTCVQKDAKVIYSLNLSIFDAKVSKENFVDWNKAVKKLKELYEYPVILSKL